MALLTLTSTLVGWYNLRFISQVEKDNTQALIPTMNMARQLSEASAWELFAAQNLTSADNEKMWQAQGRMLTAQSLKINALLQALREQGFDTTAIEQQEQEISRSLRQQGELVGRRLQLRQQQQQLSQQIVAAADEIARLAQGQANNAATSAGATQAGIYDLIEQDQRQAAESALDRLIDIDLEYVNQMNEPRLSALRVQQMVMNLGLEQIQKNAPTLEKQLNNAVKILQRRQIRIEDPGVRAQVATTLTTVSNIAICWRCISRTVKSAITYKLSHKITSPSSRSLVAKSVSWSTPLSCVISTDWRIWKKPVHAGNTACYCWGWFHFAH